MPLSETDSGDCTTRRFASGLVLNSVQGVLPIPLLSWQMGRWRMTGEVRVGRPTTAMDPLVARAVALHQQGRIPEARQAYQRILSRDPRQFVAWHRAGSLSCVLVMHKAVLLDGSALDALTLQQNGLPPAEIAISRGQVVQALVIAPVVILLDKLGDLSLQRARQVAILQQDAVLHGLVPAFDLAPGLRVGIRHDAAMGANL